MLKINPEWVSIKAHYFFFFAAMGPLLSFFPVIGRQLGLSEIALGFMSSIFPLLYLTLKPIFGYVADYFHSLRKIFFLILVAGSSITFDSIGFIQHVPTYACNNIDYCHANMSETDVVRCELVCGNTSYSVLRSDLGSLCHHPTANCLPLHSSCLLNCADQHHSPTFWLYIVLASMGNIFFNITNFYSDAICFDLLGAGNDKKYGLQRVWGTVGFGVTSLISGFLIDRVSSSLPYKNYSPAFIIAAMCMLFDLYFCVRLKLPKFSKSENIVGDVVQVLKQPRILTFLFFATCIGMMDSTIFYFLLWYLEDLADKLGISENIKLLQGLTVASESLFGEIIAFFVSEQMLLRMGYSNCLTIGLFIYSIRLALIGSISNPWMVLPIEAFLHGPSFALLYTTVVAYASAVTPPGTSATIQGFVAGMDDGLGHSLGTFFGGMIYKYYGGSALYWTYSCVALTGSIVHFILCIIFFKQTEEMKPVPEKEENEYEMGFSVQNSIIRVEPEGKVTDVRITLLNQEKPDFEVSYKEVLL